MAGLITTPPYGMKAIREIRAKNTSSNLPVPTLRLNKKKEKTYRYFLEKVDPILGECITHLLLLQPQDVTQAMIEYLQLVEQNQLVENPIGKSGQPRKELKLFLATSIGPVVAKLVNRLAAKQPENVIEFMKSELESMKSEDAIIPDKVATIPVPKPVQSEAKSIQIVVLGMGESGKTSIINSLQGKLQERVRPTLGFRPSTMMFAEDVMIRFYDLGGGKKIRDIWNQYYHDIHGIVYVVDASLPEAEFLESVALFESTMKNSYLLGKPLLIFANKQDKEGARSAKTLQEILPLPDAYADHLFIAESSSFIPEEVTEDHVVDRNIEAAIELLCKRILEFYDQIQNRVQKDSSLKAAEEARKRIEREKKVLKSKIASAFIKELDPSVIETLSVEADEANVFTSEDGIKFLAAEIGEDPLALPQIALRIASLTGYQRLALQIVGALKCPISKKKVPMSWEEILSLIEELRREIHLPSI